MLRISQKQFTKDLAGLELVSKNNGFCYKCLLIAGQGYESDLLKFAKVSSLDAFLKILVNVPLNLTVSGIP